MKRFQVRDIFHQFFRPASNYQDTEDAALWYHKILNTLGKSYLLLKVSYSALCGLCSTPVGALELI